jgi:hypothetical protein
LRAENEGVRVEVSAQGTEDARLMIDPTRFSAALRLIAHQLRGAAGAGTGALGWQAKLRRVESRDTEHVEIEIVAPSSLGEAVPRRGIQMVEWAVAGRMVEMHGGVLSAREQRLGTAGCSLTIPLAR